MLLSRQLGYIIPFHLAAAADAKYSDFLSAWLDLVVATTPPRRISKWEIFEYSSPFSRDLLPKDQRKNPTNKKEERVIGSLLHFLEIWFIILNKVCHTLCNKKNSGSSMFI